MKLIRRSTLLIVLVFFALIAAGLSATTSTVWFDRVAIAVSFPLPGISLLPYMLAGERRGVPAVVMTIFGSFIILVPLTSLCFWIGLPLTPATTALLAVGSSGVIFFFSNYRQIREGGNIPVDN